MLEVIEAGLHSTIQDSGRRGWGHLGVRRAGAADPLALASANVLAGVPLDAPAVEMTLLGASFAVRTGVVVGIAGADMEAHVPEEDRRLASGGGHRLRAGTTLVFGGALDGARAYLSVAGGLVVPSVLGSASTDPVAGFGGIEGRALAVGDVLETSPDGASGERRWPSGAASSSVISGDGPVEIAVVRGPHHHLLSESSLEAFADQAWTVTPNCDRVGLRLEGEALEGVAGLDLVSLPMLPGAVQVPRAGQPIVLMPDAPSVGGYPVPAVVAEIDQGRTGQLRPGDEVRFAWIGLAEARRRAREQTEWLAIIAASFE